MKTKRHFETKGSLFLSMVFPFIILGLSAFATNAYGQKPTDVNTEIAPPPPPPSPPPPPQQCKPPSLPHYRVFGNDTLYYQTREMPEFPGGKDALQEFKTNNIKYSDEVKKLCIEGSVFVNYMIEKDGSLSKIRIANGVSPSLDAEALRVTRLMPVWKPGKENGKPVTFASGTTYDFELVPGKKVACEENLGTAAEGNKPSGSEDEPYVMVEDMPVFPGGDVALLKFIMENTKYPPVAKEKNIQGKVIIKFCVTAIGSVSKISVLKSVDPELDTEAMRVVESLPAFEPGKQGGKAVPVWYNLPINFTLRDFKGDRNIESKELILSGYDEAPVFPGGETAINKFLLSNIIYPESAKAEKISGKVIVNYCIGTNGSIEAASIYKGIDPELDAEALRVVKLLPAWQPGKMSGKPINVWYSVPITFVLK